MYVDDFKEYLYCLIDIIYVTDYLEESNFNKKKALGCIEMLLVHLKERKNELEKERGKENEIKH